MAKGQLIVTFEALDEDVLIPDIVEALESFVYGGLPTFLVKIINLRRMEVAEVDDQTLSEHMHKAHQAMQGEQIELIPEDPPMVADGPNDEAGGMSAEELEQIFDWARRQMMPKLMERYPS